MLGESDLPEAYGAEWRFVGILPQTAPDIREFMQASLRVRQMGLRPDGVNLEWSLTNPVKWSFRGYWLKAEGVL